MIEGTFAGVILHTEQQEGITKEGKKWTRIRIYFDLCNTFLKGYFTAKKREFPKDYYKGIVDWYLPNEGEEITVMTEATEEQEEKATEQQGEETTEQQTQLTKTAEQAVNNIDAILKLNQLKSLPDDWKGLIIGVQIKKDEIGQPKISGWLTSKDVDISNADKDLSNYYDVVAAEKEKEQNKFPTLSNVAQPTIIKPKDVKPYKDILARRKAALAAAEKITNNPTNIIAPSSPAPTPAPTPTPTLLDSQKDTLSAFGLAENEIAQFLQPYNTDYRVRVQEAVKKASEEIDATAEQIEQYRQQQEKAERIADVLREIETKENENKIRWIATVLQCTRWW